MFKNPLILDQISEYPLIHHEDVKKLNFEMWWPPTKCVISPIRLAHDVTYTCPHTKIRYERLIAPSLRKLIFWEGLFSEKSSNHRVIIFWHISKMTKLDPRICLKVSCVKIWQIGSKRNCPKWSMRKWIAMLLGSVRVGLHLRWVQPELLPELIVGLWNPISFWLHNSSTNHRCEYTHFA